MRAMGWRLVSIFILSLGGCVLAQSPPVLCPLALVMSVASEEFAAFSVREISLLGHLRKSPLSRDELQSLWRVVGYHTDYPQSVLEHYVNFQIAWSESFSNALRLGVVQETPDGRLEATTKGQMVFDGFMAFSINLFRRRHAIWIRNKGESLSEVHLPRYSPTETLFLIQAHALEFSRSASEGVSRKELEALAHALGIKHGKGWVRRLIHDGVLTFLPRAPEELYFHVHGENVLAQIYSFHAFFLKSEGC
jgi:hypothetical protein